MLPVYQIEALVITVVTFILSLVLTIFLTKSYLKGRKTSNLFWSLGMWAFTIGVLLEIIFAMAIYNAFLNAFYLLIVALLVELLALGSIQLIKSRNMKICYYVFSVIATIFVIYSLIATSNANLVKDYVASEVPSLLVIYASSIITFPAAVIIAVIALLSYKRTKDYRNLSIFVGVCFVSIAGTLYIAAFPALLYISEFVGILLLWNGFFRGKK
jgi:cytochrome bd-type quinol oxidase subunit 2